MSEYVYKYYKDGEDYKKGKPLERFGGFSEDTVLSAAQDYRYKIGSKGIICGYKNEKEIFVNTGSVWAFPDILDSKELLEIEKVLLPLKRELEEGSYSIEVVNNVISLCKGTKLNVKKEILCTSEVNDSPLCVLSMNVINKLRELQLNVNFVYFQREKSIQESKLTDSKLRINLESLSLSLELF